MKLITAIIQPDKLDAVREALIAAEITRITISRVSGHGQQAEADLYRGQIIAPNLIPKVRLDIACNDEFVKITCDAIIKAARHGDDGKVGDGKIFVTTLEQCIRIRTGESGGKAI
jgi:nitrogen regulatory protein P-II 1